MAEVLGEVAAAGAELQVESHVTPGDADLDTDDDRPAPAEIHTAKPKPSQSQVKATADTSSTNVQNPAEPPQAITSSDPHHITTPVAKMMEETTVTDESDSFDESYDRPAERWAPLGAPLPTPPPSMSGDCCHISQHEHIKLMEEEQEQLTSSLLALTSHFAQIQFRLKQVVNADPQDKEGLLKELEEFAHKGIPDVRGCKVQDAQILEELSDMERENKISEQRLKQQELITQLKSQLEDLENYAYETGEGNLPTSKVLDKQKLIIDELRKKMDLNLEDFDRMSEEQLRQIVDKAVGQIVNPAKVKEKLVEQLKTQVVDLERFIDFLQGEATSPGPLGEKRCTCPVHKPGEDTPTHAADCCIPHHNNPRIKAGPEEHKKVKDTTLSILRQALTVLQLFAISQFGCGGRDFERNLLKRTEKGNHWGDLRARLEVAVENVLKLAKVSHEETVEDTDYTSDSEDAPAVQCNQALTSAVRKDLAMALKDLMEHGLMEVGQSSSLVPMGCFPNRRQRDSKPEMMHAWDLFLKYYEMKHGKEYNESTARKLSQAFSLDIVGGKPITAKQTLLGAVDCVISSHRPLKRSQDSQFKAFVCLALNEKKLVAWLKLLLKTHTLIEFYYQPWSYVIRTGFDDALESLNKLSSISFNLPVDLAVRPFQNIKDAF